MPLQKVIDLQFDQIKENIDLQRYRNNKPAILNHLFSTNLIMLIDKMPQQNPEKQLKILKINPANNIPVKKHKMTIIQTINNQDKKNPQKKGFRNIVMATKHQVDGLGNETKINQYDVMKKLLGKGSHCFVKMAKKDGQLFAIKTISLDRLKKKFYIKDEQLHKMINNQIEILLKLKHPNIIRLEEAIYAQQAQKIFLVLENCAKDLAKAIKAADSIPYQQWIKKCRRYCKQMAQSLKYIHDNGVLHRDIKTENVLLDEKDIIKIIDFNVSLQLPNNSPMITITDKFVGTKAYAPPQLVIPQNKARIIDGKKVDVWALGITFYELVQRNHPWTGKTIEDLINFLKQPIWIRPGINQSLKDLLGKMLKYQNSERISTDDIIKHPWINGQ